MFKLLGWIIVVVVPISLRARVYVCVLALCRRPRLRGHSTRHFGSGKQMALCRRPRLRGHSTRHFSVGVVSSSS